ncbi:MAG: biotin/lipoyl-binding protein [Burkholderiaceae bacterium]|nr:biotin/lipoyl-binding protein [Burkholderiaceae bacterium]
MKTILIANRGEIAVRIMRTVQRMGYRALAVYSDADAGAPHVRLADAACRIGPGPAAQSYLNIDAILQAARAQGADAVHPGYGFLAENAAFAQAVFDAGLTWIGPPPSAMQAMGNKAAAKRLLADRHVPMLPGYQGNDQSDTVLQAEAERIGLPLMIKAAAGGGGRGMRLIREASEVAQGIARARSEAQQAFGSSELILERALLAPRHVEVQVFADTHGNVVHLGERDCSVQRRHQKIIEEAPSPAVTLELRHRLGAAAVEAARSCGYVGAGTIEFLMDPDGAFWFMEMNTRLQVEHPVTEAVVGVDLVEWQLRVAAGEALPLTQAQIDERLIHGGHAIEVRLCAEDPARDFLPQAGQIARWHAPQALRVEHALEDGFEISPFYDSMVAKLVAHAPSREEARRKLVRELDDCLLLGVPTNQDLLIDALSHAEFARGTAHTGFIASHFSEPQADGDEALAQVLAVSLLLTQRSAALAMHYPIELQGWSSCAPLDIAIECELDGNVHALTVQAVGPHTWHVQAGELSVVAVVQELGTERLRVQIDGVGHGLAFGTSQDAGGTMYFRAAGRNHVLRDLSFEPAKAKHAAGGDGIVRAPMNGRVAMVNVQAGDKVQSGQTLIVLEAMKMEHALRATRDGVVGTLHVSVGEQVAPGKLLAELVGI